MLTTLMYLLPQHWLSWEEGLSSVRLRQEQMGALGLELLQQEANSQLKPLVSPPFYTQNNTLVCVQMEAEFLGTPDWSPAWHC